MKRTILLLCILIMGTTAFCISLGLFGSCCRVKKETTKISYFHHTNSGAARYTSVGIGPTLLRWSYSEARNNVHMRDSVEYDEKEFNDLIDKLSKISFYIGEEDRRLGGAGFSFSFKDNDDTYLSFDSSQISSEECQEVVNLIRQFISIHQTRCEQLFKKYASKPHKRAHFGEFDVLPQELEKYLVK